jgi:uncharacterized metal-binding protein
LPKALQDKPKRVEQLEFVWTVFGRLSRARVWDQGQPLPITIQDFMALCVGTGVEVGEFREDLLDMVQSLDQAFVKHHIDKGKSDMTAKS